MDNYRVCRINGVSSCVNDERAFFVGEGASTSKKSADRQLNSDKHRRAVLKKLLCIIKTVGLSITGSSINLYYAKIRPWSS